jgi:hypothetical protein
MAKTFSSSSAIAGEFSTAQLLKTQVKLLSNWNSNRHPRSIWPRSLPSQTVLMTVKLSGWQPENKLKNTLCWWTRLFTRTTIFENKWSKPIRPRGS